MARQVNELLVAQGGLRIPASAGAGKLAQSDASGNLSWVTVASLQGKTSTTFAAGDQTEYAFSAWKPLGYDRPFQFAAGVAAQTFLTYTNGAAALNAAGSAYCAFRLDPAWFAAGTRTVNVRVVASLAVNAVAPNVNFTFALSSVATWAGASGTRTTVATLNAALCSVAQNTPAASTQYNVQSAAAALTAGYYVLSVANSGTTATGSDVEGHVSAQYQQV